MLDFTSALYLGLRHPSGSLRSWSSLTTGVPAAMRTFPDATAVALEAAALMGFEHGLLLPSTLHLFWDLFGLLAKGRAAIYTDEGIYPIVRWGVERAARKARVGGFAHFDPNALRDCLKKHPAGDSCPIVVTDGFCPGCGRPAPLADYLEAVRERGGYLVIDDTQALGILGHSPGPFSPYGTGGGGTLRWSNLSGPDIVVGASLAKGFGAPVTVLAGSGAVVRWFEEKSETRVHCSPPSAASLAAAEHALAVNRKRGDFLRLRLAEMVRHFRRGLCGSGISPIGGNFPVQTLTHLSGLDPSRLYLHLLKKGIRTVPQRGRCGAGMKISFIITALHRKRDIDRVAHIIKRYADGAVRSHRGRINHETWIELRRRAL
jgi:8-amino-7-oxononanoate synthase